MDALKYIYDKFSLVGIPSRNAPIVLPITRAGLAGLFAELGYTIGAEIGVDQGLYSEVLCRANPDLHLYCIDAWKAYRGYTDFTSQAHLNANRENALTNLAPYNCTIVQEFSRDAVRRYSDQYFDFVYIDGNHEFLHVTEDIYYWGSKVKVGGILAGHDYRRTSMVCHVVDVVNGWTYSHEIKPWFTTNPTDTDIPSWFWVKV